MTRIYEVLETCRSRIDEMPRLSTFQTWLTNDHVSSPDKVTRQKCLVLSENVTHQILLPLEHQALKTPAKAESLFTVGSPLATIWNLKSDHWTSRLIWEHVTSLPVAKIHANLQGLYRWRINRIQQEQLIYHTGRSACFKPSARMHRATFTSKEPYW